MEVTRNDYISRIDWMRGSLCVVSGTRDIGRANQHRALDAGSREGRMDLVRPLSNLHTIPYS